MKQAKVLTEQEFKRVLAVIASGRHAARNRLALMLSHHAGLRVGEIASLSFTNVVKHDDAGIVVKHVSSVRDQIRLNPSQTKGGVARAVFMNKRLQREISKYVEGLSTLPAAHTPLIRSQKGKAFSANTLCQLFGELYRRAGIDGATSHSGRRSFITKLAHSGISAKVIMELAGHKHLTTTQRYIEVNDEMKRAAVEVL